LGLILFLCLPGFLGLQASLPDRGDWDEIWALAQSAFSGQDVFDELSHRIALEAPCLDREVALYLAAAAKGGDPIPVRCDELPELSPQAAWAYATALESSRSLNSALVETLKDCPEELVGPVLERGYKEFMAASDLADSAAAVLLGEALHKRAVAVWSAQNLAIAYTRHGAYPEAASCLIGALGARLSDPDQRLLYSRLCLVRWGEGGLLAARGALGASLCQGISDSGVVLGLSSLERGQFDRAKILFRSVLGRDPSQPWALKGWGLSMAPR
jgi:tetratricopeptide (TPR) repeat protein